MAHTDDQNTQKSNLAYIRSSMAEPMLEKDHELDLARKWRDHKDEKALHELIRSYTRLVVAAASKFKHYGLPMGDLIQEGNIGLMHAASKFDPERDFRFSTYANWWVKSSLQDYVLRNWSIVRTGTTSAQKSLFFNFRRLRAQIEGKQNHEGLSDAGRAEIAKQLDVPVKDVIEMEQRMAGGDKSLNATISIDGEEEHMALLVDDRPNPEEIVIGMKDAQTRSKWLAEALSELSAREQQIIQQRHLKHESVTLEDLGKSLGVSKERVRQLEKRAMDKLKDTLVRKIDNPRDLMGEATFWR